MDSIGSGLDMIDGNIRSEVNYGKAKILIFVESAAFEWSVIYE